MSRVFNRGEEWDDDSDLGEDDDSPDFGDDEPMIPCPYCGVDIHDETERCPHCGQYISKEDCALRPQAVVDHRRRGGMPVRRLPLERLVVSS